MDPYRIVFVVNFGVRCTLIKETQNVETEMPLTLRNLLHQENSIEVSVM